MSELDTKVMRFVAGETIIDENTPSAYLYVIKEGQVKVYKRGAQDKKLPLAVVNSGQYLGELALLCGKKHTATAIALTDVKAIQISKEQIERQIQGAPGWLVALTRNLAERLIRTNDVLRRNNIVDEQLVQAIKAAEEHNKKA